MHALVYRSLPGERRDADRFPTELGATLRSTDGAPNDVQIHDLSATGFRMEDAPDLSIGSRIWIGIAGMGPTEASVVRRSGESWGCQFVTPINGLKLAAALSAESTIVPMGSTFEGVAQGTSQAIDTDVEKWPVGWRVAFIGGSSLALWGLILWAIL